MQQAQQAASDLRQKQSAYAAAEAAHSEAEKQINVLRAQRRTGEGQLKQAQAQLEQANANLSRATLTASVAGRVTKLTAAAGAYAVPGQTLMMLVPLDLWVTANFKETQLASMRPGQRTKIEIDAYGRSFSGHVDSIQAGSGTAFSLLPAENATGNYVKVVQRVPVKIVFDRPPEAELGPGMSVVPSVKVEMSSQRSRRRLDERTLRRRRPKPLADRRHLVDRDLHGGARHLDRQRGAASHRGRAFGQHR